ncbi:unnamed protein product [Amoebophrya sp. A120]|nr:unnamed protein product [Amoebophrya sp. A120]|eukprot:GSA120T00001451001.1
MYIVLFCIHVLGSVVRVPARIAAASDAEKAAYALAWPIMAEVIGSSLRTSLATKLRQGRALHPQGLGRVSSSRAENGNATPAEDGDDDDHSTTTGAARPLDDDIQIAPIMAIFNLWRGLIGRFLVASFDSTGVALTTLTMQAFEEIVMRQTFDWRDRMYAKYVNRRSPEHIERDFTSRLHRSFQARVLLSEMQTEYIAIVLAPLSILLFSGEFRYVYNLGYQKDKSVMLAHLLPPFLLGLLYEILVDALCLTVEQTMYKVPVEEEWQQWIRLPINIELPQSCKRRLWPHRSDAQSNLHTTSTTAADLGSSEFDERPAVVRPKIRHHPCALLFVYFFVMFVAFVQFLLSFDTLSLIYPKCGARYSPSDRTRELNICATYPECVEMRQDYDVLQELCE